jgi:mannosyltransferase OCH1-like enzyme
MQKPESSKEQKVEFSEIGGLKEAQNVLFLCAPTQNTSKYIKRSKTLIKKYLKFRKWWCLKLVHDCILTITFPDLYLHMMNLKSSHFYHFFFTFRLLRFVMCFVSLKNSANRIMIRCHIIAYACLLAIVILWLTSHIVRYAWQNRSPMRMVYATDVARYSNKTSARRRIPRLIHQIWRTHVVPSRWNATFHSVLAQNAGEFTHHLWTDDEMHTFVRDHEPKFYESIYINYPYEIQRVDSFRYVLLYHLGGVYIDLDVGCNRSLTDLLNTLEALDPNSPHLAALPRDMFSIGIESDFLISTPAHPFYKQLISRLHLFNHYYLLPFWTVLISTGPIYVGIQERLFSSSSQKDTIRILNYDVVQSMFLWKVVGQAWTGTDASVIFFINANMSRILWYGIIVGIALVTIFMIRRYRQRQ